jgi:carbon storage regulator CsrA
MLVLSRKKTQAINLYIGEELIGTLRVVELNGKRVRLGFEFADKVSIAREEIEQEKEVMQK